MSKKGIQTREMITLKSLQLFSVKGYFNTSIYDILAATGLTKGGLYGHFKSKEDIWYAVYDEAVRIWKERVFPGIRGIQDPLERIERVIDQDMRNYLGADVFEGGCFFLNSLVELSGQSSTMAKHILKGFMAFSRLIRSWFEEADRLGILRRSLNPKETANFIIISLNGAAALYAASRDKAIWEQTANQLRVYVRQLREGPTAGAEND
ncbi:MAG: TetR/AcrR family transcriptional regulator [Deltaproteobacteria bacterium]|nr:TetR/AcrR family transcriptional regulator [Deltaproteobacteria bacterium]